MDNYKTRSESCEILGIHYKTLYKLAENKEIETIIIGKQQLYNVKKYLELKGLNLNENIIRRRICYCRVSSSKQKEDLKRQIEYMQQKYPTFELISDVGSGLNMNREGLKKIIDYLYRKKINI